MEALVAFAAALLAFRLAGLLAAAVPEQQAARAARLGGRARRLRGRSCRDRVGRGRRLGRPRVPRLLRSRRVYSPRRCSARARSSSPAAAAPRRSSLVYTGFAVGIALAVPVHGTFAAHGIPAAQDHLAFVPARLLAIVANIAGTLAVVVVALRRFRRRPLGNGLIIAGIAAAATGSGLAGLGAAGSAIGIAIGAVLLYAGFVAPAHIPASFLAQNGPSLSYKRCLNKVQTCASLPS